MINAPALAAGAFTLSISTVAGTQYTLEATSTLTPVAWTPLQSVTGTGAAMTLVDGHAAGAMKFYRVRVGGP
jgi:hypothetical protein